MAPKRTADTMSEAIAMSSPSGRMSKRARDAATARLGVALFGPGGLERPKVTQPTERENLLRAAADLRELAARGMRTKAYTKQAEMLEKRAAELE